MFTHIIPAMRFGKEGETFHTDANARVGLRIGDFDGRHGVLRRLRLRRSGDHLRLLASLDGFRR